MSGHSQRRMSWSGSNPVEFVGTGSVNRSFEGIDGDPGGLRFVPIRGFSLRRSQLFGHDEILLMPTGGSVGQGKDAIPDEDDERAQP